MSPMWLGRRGKAEHRRGAPGAAPDALVSPVTEAARALGRAARGAVAPVWRGLPANQSQRRRLPNNVARCLHYWFDRHRSTVFYSVSWKQYRAPWAGCIRPPAFAGRESQLVTVSVWIPPLRVLWRRDRPAGAPLTP